MGLFLIGFGCGMAVTGAFWAWLYVSREGRTDE